MSHLFTHIKELIGIENHSRLKVSGKEMKELKTIKNAYLLIDSGTIVDFGSMDQLKMHDISETSQITDASKNMILPAWCDSHTHLVYAGSREQEFVDRINGFTYEEIANRGGGILNSAKRLQQTDEEAIYEQSAARLEEIMKLGTAAVEIKSGYGLTTQAELKMLRIIKRLRETYPISIKATFLGAHAIPVEYKNNRNGYINLLINEMLPEIASENLADFIDVFCETNYFTVDETIQIIKAGKKYGLKPKIHVNQFTSIGGIKAAVDLEALSVDHLEVMNDTDFDILKNSQTMPVALPSCSFFINIPYTPARKIIDSGLPLALATDFNPGTTPGGNMNFVVSTACIKMKMTPEEAINATTLNGAYAMNLSETHGSICRGKKANLIFTKDIPSYSFLPYSFASNLIEKVMISGDFIS